MKKKICSFVLIFAMLAMLLPSGLVGTTVYADSFITSASNANGSNYTQSNALAAKLNDVFIGNVGLYSNSSLTNVFTAPLGCSKMTSSNQCWVRSNTTGNTLSGWQCYIYANGVYNTLFNEWVGHGGSYSHSRNVITGGSSVSYNQFVNAGVRCGAYIRTTSNSDGSYNGNAGHSLIVLSYDSSNLTCLEGNADGNGLVRISTRSWSSFNSVHLTNRSRYISHIVQPTDSYYDSLYSVAKPTQATITVNKTKFEVGEPVTFTFSANNNPSGFTIGIDKDGSRIITADVNNPYSISTLEAGSYSAYVTAWNSAGGCDSNLVTFTVGAIYPGKPTLSVKAGSDTFATTFSWSATSDTEWYDLRVYKSDGTKILEQKEIRGTSFSQTFASGSYYASLASCNGTYGTWTFGDDYTYFDVEKSYFIPKATVYNNGHIYSLYNDAMTWTDAKARCERVGGHLVTITSASEQSLVEGFLSSGTRFHYWLGASDAETEGTFKWVTGESFSYSNWYRKMPHLSPT